ncbi:MAG: hypothetical protein ACJAVW_003696, partial [Spirosomataceae bacterium]
FDYAEPLEGFDITMEVVRKLTGLYFKSLH